MFMKACFVFWLLSRAEQLSRGYLTRKLGTIKNAVTQQTFGSVITNFPVFCTVRLCSGSSNNPGRYANWCAKIAFAASLKLHVVLSPSLKWLWHIVLFLASVSYLRFASLLIWLIPVDLSHKRLCTNNKTLGSSAFGHITMSTKNW